MDSRDELRLPSRISREDLEKINALSFKIGLPWGLTSEAFQEIISLLIEVSKKTDINQLLDDPLLEEVKNFLLRHGHQDPLSIQRREEKEEIRSFISYTQFLKVQNKTPNVNDFKQYLEEVNASLSLASLKKYSPVKSEINAVEARKIWSDMVSTIDKLQADQAEATKEGVFERLRKLQYPEKDIPRIYEECIQFLKTNTALVVSFNGGALERRQGLTRYQLLTYFHKFGMHNDDSVQRDLFEPRQFTRDPTKEHVELYKKFISNNDSRPRFGALYLLDENQSIASLQGYGRSFMVFRDIVKFNSLFNSKDSGNNMQMSWGKLTPCTMDHFEVLLSECSPVVFAGIVQRVTQGTLPNEYNQQTNSSQASSYIEVLLPALPFLDPNFVEHIHIDSSDYVFKKQELDFLREQGITVTNAKSSPYPALCKEFMQSIKDDKVSRVKQLIQQYPSLLRITDSQGQEPIHIAAQAGSIALIQLFVHHGADQNRLTPSGDTPLHLAVKANNNKGVSTLLNVANINLKIKNNEGLTALDLASSKGNEKIIHLFQIVHIKKIIDLFNNRIKVSKTSDIDENDDEYNVLDVAYQNFSTWMHSFSQRQIPIPSYHMVIGFLIEQSQRYEATHHKVGFFSNPNPFLRIKKQYEHYLKDTEEMVQQFPDNECLLAYQESVTKEEKVEEKRANNI